MPTSVLIAELFSPDACEAIVEDELVEGELIEEMFEEEEIAKEETIKIINIAGANLPDNAKGADLAKNIFEVLTSLEKQPAQFAILTLKKEIRQLF